MIQSFTIAKKAWLLIQILLTFLLQCYSEPLLAQAPIRKVWDKTFGGRGSDELLSVITAVDGGYLLGGRSDSGADGDKTNSSKGGKDYWIVKINSDGSKSWDKSYGGSGNEIFLSMTKTVDGGYLLGGRSDSGAEGDKTEASKGGEDYWVVKIDAAGNKIWDRTFGGSGNEVLISVISTTDGGFLLGGSSDSDMNGDKSAPSWGNTDFWVVKINSDGNKVWDKTYGGSKQDVVWSMTETSDGGYLLGGWSQSEADGDKTESSRGGTDYWIVKINADGSKVWDKTLGGSEHDYLYSLTTTEDGGYLLGGQSYSGASGDKTESYPSVYWVVKLNSDGSKEWDKSYGGEATDAFITLTKTKDGGYLLGGYTVSGIGRDKTEPNIGDWDYWIVKINADGNKIWDKNFGGSGSDYLFSLAATSDGGYILGGMSSSGASGDKSEERRNDSGNWIFDYWVIKIVEAPVAPTVNGTIRCGSGAVTMVAAGAPAGGSYRWYTVETEGAAIANATNATYTTPVLSATTIYYVSVVNVHGYESTRTAVTVTINAIPTAPTVTAAISYCQGATATALTATGSNLKWYTTATGGTALSFTPTPATTSVGSTAYYVSQTVNDCESARAMITITVNALPAAPAATEGSNCGPGTVTLSASGGTAGILTWYTTPAGGDPLHTGPSYTTPTLSSTSTYYVAFANSNCESTRTPVTATINTIPATPTVNATRTLCQGATTTALTATGSNLKWYTTATGGTASTTAPTPATTTVGTTDYYVSQTVNGCESPRASLAVTVNALPTVTLDAFGNAICNTNSSYPLTGGQPAGGTYFGTSISNGIFNAASAGVGTHTVAYTYTANGCPATATQDITVSVCTGITESELAAGLSLYPNPTNDQLQIVLPLSKRTDLEIRLVDAKGRIILTQHYQQVSGDFYQTLDLREKSRGVYMLQIITDKEVITKRIIKE